jgi:cytochrome c-type biogenesis protein CcmE
MKIKYIVGGLIVIVLVAALVYVSVGQGSAYYITIEEALAGKAQPGQAIRIDGYAGEGTVVWDAPAVTLRFDLVDQERTHRLPVVFHDAPPEGFTEGGGLMVEGTMGDDGTFQASQLLTRCPSKYEEYK